MEWMFGLVIAAFLSVIVAMCALFVASLILVIVDMLRDFWRYWRSS